MTANESACGVCRATEGLGSEGEALFVAGYICGRADERMGVDVVLCERHADLMRNVSDGMSVETVTIPIGAGCAPS